MYVCVYARACAYGAVVCAVDFQLSNEGLIPAKCGHTRLSSPSLSLGGYQQPNVYVCVCGVRKKRKEEKRIVTGQKQPL